MKIQDHLTLEHFSQMEQLELQYYDAEYITPYTESYNWYIYRKDTIVAIEDDHRIIAFMNLFPIRPDIYEQIASGKFNDSMLTTNHIIAPHSNPEQVSYFLSCVVVDEPYRKTPALNMMLHHYIKHLNAAEQHGCQIKQIVMDTVTEAGSRFAIRLGMEMICHSDHHSTVYACSYQAFKQAILDHYKV